MNWDLSERWPADTPMRTDVRGLTNPCEYGNMGGEGGAVIVESLHMPRRPLVREVTWLAVNEVLGSWLASGRQN